MAVIDSDAHVLETNHTWDYMLESERDMRPRIVPTPNDSISGGESWLVDGTYIGKARNVGHDTSKEAREMEDIKARLKHMDELDIDVQVLYPTIFLRPFTRRPEVELAVTRSYNRWLIDIWKTAPERLRWVAVLPLLVDGQSDRRSALCQRERRLRHLHARSGRRQAHQRPAFFSDL